VIGRNIGERESHKIRLNGQFAPAAIHQHGQADRPRPAEIAQSIHRGTNRAAGKQHVIHQKQRALVEIDVDIRRPNQRTRADFGKIVAIKGNVQNAPADFVEAAFL
jgi:hypothetical protein